MEQRLAFQHELNLIRLELVALMDNYKDHIELLEKAHLELLIEDVDILENKSFHINNILQRTKDDSNGTN